MTVRQLIDFLREHGVGSSQVVLDIDAAKIIGIKVEFTSDGEPYTKVLTTTGTPAIPG